MDKGKDKFEDSDGDSSGYESSSESSSEKPKKSKPGKKKRRSQSSRQIQKNNLLGAQFQEEAVQAKAAGDVIKDLVKELGDLKSENDKNQGAIDVGERAIEYEEGRFGGPCHRLRVYEEIPTPEIKANWAVKLLSSVTTVCGGVIASFIWRRIQRPSPQQVAIAILLSGRSKQPTSAVMRLLGGTAASPQATVLVAILAGTAIKLLWWILLDQLQKKVEKYAERLRICDDMSFHSLPTKKVWFTDQRAKEMAYEDVKLNPHYYRADFTRTLELVDLDNEEIDPAGNLVGVYTPVQPTYLEKLCSSSLNLGQLPNGEDIPEIGETFRKTSGRLYSVSIQYCQQTIAQVLANRTMDSDSIDTLRERVRIASRGTAIVNHDRFQPTKGNFILKNTERVATQYWRWHRQHVDPLPF